jgi:hypothetical protein
MYISKENFQCLLCKCVIVQETNFLETVHFTKMVAISAGFPSTAPNDVFNSLI